MPWKVTPVEDIRFAFVHQVRGLGRPIAPTCREFGISRKTGYKWLGRAAGGSALSDRPRRPRRSPAQTAAAAEAAILEAHERFGWGARKLWAYLRDRGVDVPAPRTVHRVLRRAGRVRSEPEPGPAPLRFEHDGPNRLWQMDFKGAVEVERRRVHPLTVLDDHSRFLLELRVCDSPGASTAWPVLWELFGRVGLPEAVLCDNAFGSYFHSPRTLSRFEANLLLLGVRCVHGRPYHPQTQGKVERLHGTLERELIPGAERACLRGFQRDLDHWRLRYNAVRPHEALDDKPPITRWTPSPRRRPPRLPEASYPAGAKVRRVTPNGTVRYRRARILAGYGIIGEPVRIAETATTVELYFAERRIRSLDLDQLATDRVL